MTEDGNSEPTIKADISAKIEAKIDVPADVSRETLAFLQRLLGPFAEASDFLGEKIRFYRWKSAIGTLLRARQIIEKEGLEPTQLPLKFLVPFLEDCSLEDPDCSLVERWARLLAAATGGYRDEHLAFSRILAELSPTEAELLRKLWTMRKTALGVDYLSLARLYSEPMDFDGIGRPAFTASETASLVSLHVAADEVTKGFAESTDILPLLNLERLRLIKITAGHETSPKDMILYRVQAVITPLGEKFLTACEGNRPEE